MRRSRSPSSGATCSRKSQICHTLCVTAQQSKEGGLGGGVIFIDTEGTFRPERVKQIAEENNVDYTEILKNVILSKVYNSNHLELVMSLGKYIEQYRVKLLIVDSIISLHRVQMCCTSYQWIVGRLMPNHDKKMRTPNPSSSGS